MNRRELLGKSLALSAVGLLVPRRLLEAIPRSLIEGEDVKQFEFDGHHIEFSHCTFERDVLLNGYQMGVYDCRIERDLVVNGSYNSFHTPYVGEKLRLAPATSSMLYDLRRGA